MSLYQEILLLDNFFKGKYCVENVKSYYNPLVKPQELGGHYYWANFHIGKMPYSNNREHDSGLQVLSEFKGFNLDKYHNIDKVKTLRNCVEPEHAKHILKCAFKLKQESLIYA
jgi:DNA (cytosine-5)-methyltransferase 1